MTTTTTPLIGATMIAREVEGVALVSEVDDTTGRERIVGLDDGFTLHTQIGDVETLRALRSLLNAPEVAALLEGQE